MTFGASTGNGAIGSSNPEYVNARVRARRAALYDDDDYHTLVRMGPGEIARFMEESEYETEINALGARYSGVELIEYALNRNLAKHFDDLLNWAEGLLHDLIARYLRTYDAWNVKTIIRGIYTDSDPDEVDADLIRAGELDDQRLDQLLAAEGIDEAIELLSGTLYYEPLQEAYREFEESDTLVPLENAVDREFYTNLLGDVRESGYDEGPMALYEEFLQAEIDFLNTKNALRLARSGADMDPAAYFIPGGELFTPAELRSLVESIEDLVEHIRTSPYGDDLSTALDQLEEADSLVDFERALEAALLEYSDKLANVYPVSVSAVLSYILAKEREVENIRAIAHGREVGLDDDEIRAELVIL